MRERSEWVHLPFREWMSWNLNLTTLESSEPWNENLAICLWLLWKWRNDGTFNGIEASLESKINMAYAYSREAFVAFSNQGLAMQGSWRPRLQWIGWETMGA